MNVVNINCPVCEWIYVVPPINQDINADTLAGVFGHGIMAQHALNRQAQDTERALETHLKTHSIVEWTRKVAGLEFENRVLRDRLSGLE